MQRWRRGSHAAACVPFCSSCVHAGLHRLPRVYPRHLYLLVLSCQASPILNLSYSPASFMCFVTSASLFSPQFVLSCQPGNLWPHPPNDPATSSSHLGVCISVSHAAGPGWVCSPHCPPGIVTNTPARRRDSTWWPTLGQWRIRRCRGGEKYRIENDEVA